jgi:hypothetical protein
VRFVPRVERGEAINVGAILFSRPRRFLAARVELDRARLRAFAPGVDLALLERHLGTFVAIAAGEPGGGRSPPCRNPSASTGSSPRAAP